MTPNTMLAEIRSKTGMSKAELAKVFGVSYVSIDRWERGSSEPSPVQAAQIAAHYAALLNLATDPTISVADAPLFASHHLQKYQLGLFEIADDTDKKHALELTDTCNPPILDRICSTRFFDADGAGKLARLLADHKEGASTAEIPPVSGMSAGKNTYTYDAHTYHTKVPPQGIAELLLHYLPTGGLVLDPFAGSGMTGVAASVSGHDCLLNELSPAACFIANRFTSRIDPDLFISAVDLVLKELKPLRKQLYTTTCRKCRREAELLYTVWSYCVVCPACQGEFLLWDHCRSYGGKVKEHKILKEFDCPFCGKLLEKRTLKRTSAVPVMVGYKCSCTKGNQEEMFPPSESDLELLAHIEQHPPLASGFYPTTELPNGINLRQPISHGLTSIDRFYTPRNLAALSQLWKAIHRVNHVGASAHLAFVFTSLYQRVTRLSEFRFWGGSGNTPRFNVPYLFNEANVFVTFERKARSIADHLRTTAAGFKGRVLVVQNSATSLDYLPDNSVDMIFTDPPFGGNINYSEMNLLWEAWLERYTDNTSEAIINKFQGKDLSDYRQLMAMSMRECYRVLRSGHWMLLMFMNSSGEVWRALRAAILDAGFHIEHIDTFDKQHATEKQLVSENTAGLDLIIHCRKLNQSEQEPTVPEFRQSKAAIVEYLRKNYRELPTTVFLHVNRQEEIDYRQLYSRWLSQALLSHSLLIDFAEFRHIVQEWVQTQVNSEYSTTNTDTEGKL